MNDILFIANSLTSYMSTVCFNHPKIDWINGTIKNKPYPFLIIFNFLKSYY